MTNNKAVATENAEKVTKTICRECGETITSKYARMVACPACELIQYAGKGSGKCIGRRDNSECCLPGSHTGECDFGELLCKTHQDHAYTKHSCGCFFCERYWKSCPRCFGRDNFEANLKEGA